MDRLHESDGAGNAIVFQEAAAAVPPSVIWDLSGTPERAGRSGWAAYRAEWWVGEMKE